MNILAQLALLWPSRNFRRAAEAELKAAHFPINTDEIWPEVKRQWMETPPSSKDSGAGLRLLFEYVRWCLALYRTLLNKGCEKPEVLRLIEAIQWRMLEPASNSTFLLSRLRSSSLAARVRWLMDMGFRVLFTRPYKREVLESNNDIAFNVTRCPFAEYLRDEGAPELTGAALCALDNHMAKQWGVELQRTTTIATGGKHCDFKFVIPVDAIKRSGN